MKRTNPGKPGISRYEYDRAKGWYVRYRSEGVPFDKLFHDSAFGGSEAALKKAEAYHSELLELFPPLTRKQLAERKTKRTGEIAGVRRTRSVVKGKEYFFWTAGWSPEYKKRKTKSFSIHKYGEEGAKKLAIEARRKGLDQMDDEVAFNYDEAFIWSFDDEDISSGSNIDDIKENEGTERLAIHRTKERSRKLRTKKLEAFVEKHGRLFCEVCGFDFERTYGALGRSLIEVHHTKAIADYDEHEETKIEDLVCLCSNCHYVVHRDANYESNYSNLLRVFELKNNSDNQTSLTTPDAARPTS